MRRPRSQTEGGHVAADTRTGGHCRRAAAHDPEVSRTHAMLERVGDEWTPGRSVVPVTDRESAEEVHLTVDAVKA
jgi:hypothetical protein